ncbi:MAG: hypothetical protein OEV74_11315 [Cyclobacteriaceae bacterium]|nr:hypothetical protein [Cyclobacteriaceae bacterium]
MQAKSILCKCPSERNAKVKNSHASLVSALLIALIPKCPFCILAYSTAITVCSAKAMPHIPGWTSYVSISLAMITLFIVLYNYKGTRTLIACATILLGAALISHSELYSGNIAEYYTGSVALFTGIWANGSFLFIVRMFRSKILKQTRRISVHHG